MNDVKMTDSIKRAVTWISEEQQEKRGKPLIALLDEAGVRFNLSPRDGQFLRRFFEASESQEHDLP